MNVPLPQLLDPAVDETLERRALRARAARDTGEAAVTIPVAQFTVGSGTYAIPLEALRAVLPLKMVAPVPRSPVHVIGILRFQGQLVTAVSLMALLGVNGWRRDCAVLLVVELDGGRRVAVDCEHIPRIEALSQRAVEQARARGRGPVHDVVTEGLQTVGLIDLAALLAKVAEGPHG